MEDTNSTMTDAPATPPTDMPADDHTDMPAPEAEHDHGTEEPAA